MISGTNKSHFVFIFLPCKICGDTCVGKVGKDMMVCGCSQQRSRKSQRTLISGCILTVHLFLLQW